jgi:hypothetical protein
MPAGLLHVLSRPTATKKSRARIRSAAFGAASPIKDRVFRREAGIATASVRGWLLLLVALFMRSFGVFRCGLRLLPGLGRMLLSLGMVVLAVRIRGRAM